MEVMAIVTVGIDLAKNVFAVHGVDELGNPVLVRPEVPRGERDVVTRLIDHHGEPGSPHTDWRIGNADSMSARTTPESTLDAGYTTAGASPTAKLSVSFLRLRGSPYTNS
jgi:hypothetical protein